MALSICLSFSLSLRPRCLSIVLSSCLPVPVHMCNLPIFLSFLLSLFNSYICLSVSAIVNVCLTVFLLFIVPFFHNSVAGTVCLYVSKYLCISIFVRFSICILSFCFCLWLCIFIFSYLLVSVSFCLCLPVFPVLHLIFFFVSL